MMNLNISHLFLTGGRDGRTARSNVLRFLDQTTLVKYDRIHIVEEHILSAEKRKFWPDLEASILENRRVIVGFINELTECGVKHLDDIKNLEQGYQSKTLHTIAHLLDGFFGIDSCFFNLIEDSHWLSAVLKDKIMENPGQYWLVEAHPVFEASQLDRDVLSQHYK
ncbi:MAG: hypothetical protein U9R66_11785 [Thermodesulfobacteriota bacterium]|nr:hypothetical protein [Thermodesulfobacteriota bacterium]